MKTLLVVDGNSIMNRAYYGIRPLTSSSGLHTNAVYGMITMLSHQLESIKPDLAAIAYDLRTPTFRHKLTESYKAGRKGMPPELCEQVEYCHRAAEVLGLHGLTADGYEADDILGTLAAMAERDGDIRTVIMTGDRDSLQLISENTSVLLATNTDYIMYDRTKFFEKYGVEVEQFVDLKAIMGDSSDNIPGVPGIGEKGAVALISRFGSLETLLSEYKTAGGLTPSTLKKLDAGADSARLSRQLAEICRSVPDMPAPSSLEFCGMDRVGAKKLFSELEFSGFIKKWELDRIEEEVGPASTPVLTAEVKNVSDREALASLLCSGASVSIALSDGELSATADGVTVFYAPLDGELSETLSSTRVTCYDCKHLYEAVGGYRGAEFDVMLASYAINAQGKHDFDGLILEQLGEVRSDDTPDAVYIHRLRAVLEPKLAATGAERLFYEIEMPLAAVLADMESEGFLIDREGIAEYGRELSAAAEAIEHTVYFMAGHEFNINSPKQLATVLFEELGLPAGKKTKSGYSTNADILEKLAPDHEIVRSVLDYRQLTKLYSTYIVGLLKVADESGRVHSSFKQTGTATGRLSSAEPNLQNIPIRTEIGRNLRKYFLPREGCLLVDADYSQIELRLLAHISGDENMCRTFREGGDIHTSTAAAVFGVPEGEVTEQQRKRAKAVNFGIVYGIGDFSLAGDLEIPVKQARAYIESYLGSYPGVSKYLKDTVEQAKADGYVTTMYGRRRYIPEINGQNGMLRKFGERVAMNSPIQGSAADIMKLAMIGVSRALKEEGLDARIVLQVHDELVLEASRKDAPRAGELLRREMEAAAALSVPLTVDLTVGERWYAC